MRDKTANEKFFVLTLFAIAYELLHSEKYVPGMTTEIDLAIGLPPGHIGKQYEEFEKYFVRNEIINFEFNQKKFRIYIKSATAYPQGYAAIMPMYPKVKEYPRSVIIDIGGYSLDYLQLKNGKADITEASCPDHVCVDQRSISKTGEAITCLPNKTVITVDGEEEAEIDFVS